MSGRYTKRELADMSDLKFAMCILQERRNGLTNPYSPLAEKLRRTIHILEDLDRKPVRVNWWSITFTDEDGEKRPDCDVDDGELNRIGKMVAEGYTGGEIYNAKEDE
jgi:hypothetical protein